MGRRPPVEGTSLNEIADILSKDPPLTVKILGLINSAFYSLQDFGWGDRISSVDLIGQIHAQTRAISGLFEIVGWGRRISGKPTGGGSERGCLFKFRSKGDDKADD